MSKRLRKPRPLHKPESHNHTTQICGISQTYKMNKKRDDIKYPCFSILIGPGSVVSRGYTKGNENEKLQESIAIRAAAIDRWPHFNATDARYVSDKFKLLTLGCPKCSSEIYQSDVGDGTPGELLRCILCGWRLYSPYPDEYAHLY